MSEAKTKYFKSWLSREIDLVSRQVAMAWKEIDSKAAAQGWYQSGRRIRECVRSVADTIAELADMAFDKAIETENALENHSLVDSLLVEFLDELTGEIPAMVQSTGASTPKLNTAVNQLVSQIGIDLATRTRLAKLEIEAKASEADSPLTHHLQPSTSDGKLSTAPASKRKPESNAKFKSWFTKRLETWLESSLPPPTEEVDVQAAKLSFPGIGRARVREMRKQVYPESWLKSGPRRASSQD